MTINRALRELTADGLLMRMQGVGTFVAERKGHSALFEVNNIADEIKSRPSPSLQGDSPNRGSRPERAFALNMREGQRVFHSLLVHYEDDVAVQLEDRYVNAVLAPDYLQQDFVVQTPYAYLSRVAPLTEGEHVVEAILAEAEECRLLQIDHNEPCLLIRRRTWSGNQAVTSARLIHPGAHDIALRALQFMISSESCRRISAHVPTRAVLSTFAGMLSLHSMNASKPS